MGLWDFKVSWSQSLSANFNSSGIRCRGKEERRNGGIQSRRTTKKEEPEKEKPACSVVEQAGVPIDRVIGFSIERKGLFYLLTIAFGKWIVKELNHSAN